MGLCWVAKFQHLNWFMRLKNKRAAHFRAALFWFRSQEFGFSRIWFQLNQPVTDKQCDNQSAEQQRKSGDRLWRKSVALTAQFTNAGSKSVNQQAGRPKFLLLILHLCQISIYSRPGNFKLILNGLDAVNFPKGFLSHLFLKKWLNRPTNDDAAGFSGDMHLAVIQMGIMNDRAVNLLCQSG